MQKYQFKILFLLSILLAFFTDSYSQISPNNYFQFNTGSPLTSSVGSGTITGSAAYTIVSGGQVGSFMRKDIDYSGNLLRLPNAVGGTALSIQFLMRPGRDFQKVRNATVVSVGSVSIGFEYPNVLINYSFGAGQQLTYNLNGINKKSWKTIYDGNWHLISLTVNAPTGNIRLFIDAESPSEFNDTVPGGATIYNGDPSSYLTTTVSFTNYPGDLDELATYAGVLTPNQVRRNWLEVQAGNHYTSTLEPVVPPYQPTTAGYDTSEYLPNYPSNTITVEQQLDSFPGPRYRPAATSADSLRWISSCYDPYYLGGATQSGISNAQAVLNGVNRGSILATKWHHVISMWQVGPGVNLTDTVNSIPAKTIARVKANRKLKLEAATFAAQLSPFCKLPCDFNQPYITGYPSYYFLQNGSGVPVDANGNPSPGNKKPRPSITLAQSYSNFPDTAMNQNRDSLDNVFDRIDVALGADINLYSVWENGEIVTLYGTGMNVDPVVSANVAASGLTNRQFESAWYTRWDTANYKNGFIGNGHTSTDSTYYWVYQNQGNESYFFDYRYRRLVHTPYRGFRPSSTDLYIRTPGQWHFANGANHSIRWLMDNQPTELGVTQDRIFIPYVSAGWDITENNNVSPPQYLGLLKIFAACGAESFLPSVFSLGSPNPKPENYLWAITACSYVQAVTSHYERLFHHSYLMQGDLPQVNTAPLGAAAYFYNSGDFRVPIAIRKDSTALKYAIVANLNRNANMIGNTEDTVIRYITLAGNNITFTIPQQGCVNYYDNTNPSAPVFFPLDSWHEKTHPYRWNKDILMQAEVHDNTSELQYKTDVAPGNPMYNFVNATSYISYSDTTTVLDSIRYNFRPVRTATYYVWVRMKSRTGVATGVTIRLNGGTTYTFPVTNTGWFWYRLNNGTGSGISYSLTGGIDQHFSMLPINKYVEIDQLVFTLNPNANYPEATSPCTTTSTITPSPGTSACQGSTVVLTANVNTSYLWSNGATTQSVNVTSTGTYTVTVTNGLGCTGVSAPVTVTISPLPSTPIITPSGPTTFCSGGSVDLTSTTGTTYLWSNAATTQTITVTSAATYTVTVTNAAGCTKSSAGVVVTVNSLPSIPAITPTGSTTFCSGSSVILTSDAATSYLWSTGAISQAITTTTAGDYTVTVTNASGCTRSSATTTVTVLPKPIIAPLSPIQNTCPAITVDLSTITLVNSGETITATTYYATLTDAQNATNAIAAVVGASATYYIRGEAANGCYDVVAEAVTIVSCACASPPAANAGSDQTICAGSTVTLAGSIVNSTVGTWTTSGTGTFTPNSTTLTAVYTPSAADTVSGLVKLILTTNNPLGAPCAAGTDTMAITISLHPMAVASGSGSLTFCSGGSVDLTVTPIAASYVWSNGLTTQGITVSSSGNFSVITTNSAGCTSGTSNVLNVTVNTRPSTPTVTPAGPQSVCFGGSIILTATSATSWLWSTGATTQSITASTTGLYRVTVTNATGCTRSSNGKTVTVQAALPTPVITPGGNLTICQGGSITLVSSTGDSYLWSNGAITPTITVSTAGSYTVTVTTNGCTAVSAAKTVSVTNNPTATINNSSGSSTICYGASTTLTASNGTSWLWSTGDISQSIVVDTTGIYVVTVTNSGGCSAQSPPLTLTSYPAIDNTITPSGATTFCSGGSVGLSAAAGYNYLWSNGATTQATSATTSGNYTVIVINAGGCTSVGGPTLVTVYPLPSIPVITPPSPISLCASQTVSLSTGVYAGYNWSNGATTQSISVATPGSYYVTVNNSSGCTSVSAVAVVQAGTALNPTITASGATTACAGSGLSLTSSVATSYLWSNGKTERTIFPTVTGNYIVTVTDAFGCSKSSAGKSVTIKTSPSATITPQGATKFCQGGGVILSSSDGVKYLWSDGSITKTIASKTTATYTVTVTATNGCTARSSPASTFVKNCTISCAKVLGSSIIDIQAKQVVVAWPAETNAQDTVIAKVKQVGSTRPYRETICGEFVYFGVYFNLSANTEYYWQLTSVCNGVRTDSTTVKKFKTKPR